MKWIILCFFLSDTLIESLKITENDQKEITELIVVRSVHEIAPGVGARLEKFAQDLKTNLPSAHFMVSVDETKGELNHSFPESNLHRYTWPSLVDSYPVLKTAHEDLTRAAGISPRFQATLAKIPPPHAYHAEPILAAWEHAKKKLPMAKDHKMWVLESDVLICGKISTLIKEYGDDESDLLGFGPLIMRQQKYLTRHGGNDAFRDKYNNTGINASFPDDYGKVSVQKEHVQRFSSKLLEMLRHSSKDLKINAHSEIYIPTLCLSEPENCKHGQFKKKNVGLLYWNRQWKSYSMGPEKAKEACQWVKEGEATINHAAKW